MTNTFAGSSVTFATPGDQATSGATSVVPGSWLVPYLNAATSYLDGHVLDATGTQSAGKTTSVTTTATRSATLSLSSASSASAASLATSSSATVVTAR